MAEGWARHLHGANHQFFSAGIETHGLNPLAVKAMGEAGVDISAHQSKMLENISAPLDLVITVCGHADETCPMFPGNTRKMHVGFDDPPKLAADAKNEEEALVHYRRVRDEIRHFIEGIEAHL